MSRRQFIESHGATCLNWTWSWSFVNTKKKVVIFGAWDRNTDGNTSLILSETWERRRGRKQPAYKQAREHIRLVEEDGYKLMTFPMKYSDANKDENGIGPAKIDGFEPRLQERTLKKVGGSWYASDDFLGSLIPEEVETPEQFVEGASKTVAVNTFERNAEARAKCIKHHGYKCAVCGFDFAAYYGSIGEEYIHVHHVVPLSEIGREYILDPTKDLVPVCPNCHAIIHRTRPAMSVEQLRRHLAERNAKNT
jgi:5-methylcytosine-specific restriction enzyme A